MAALFLGFVLLCSVGWWLSKRRTAEKKLAPEAGRSWPLIGHLLLLRRSKAAHIVLGDMADKFGPIFRLKMGARKMLVISNWETAKECFTTHDRTFASRPNSLFAETLGYDRTMLGLSPYGEHWRQMRKIATLDLLSNQRVQMFRAAREAEIQIAARELLGYWEANRNSSNQVEIDMRGWFADVTLNLISKVIIGKAAGYDSGDGEREKSEWKTSLNALFDVGGKFVVADSMPFLKWFDIGGDEATMRSIKKTIDRVVGVWLKEHRQGNTTKKEMDFMDVLIRIIDSQTIDFEGHDPDDVIISNCLGYILGASHTTSVSMSWALALLVNHPEILRKAQQEIDAIVGEDRKVTEEDTKSMVYLDAIIKETLRLYPAAPLSLPHFSTSECTVAGYHVPEGTTLLTNLWKIQRDPRVWENPTEFCPERFVGSEKADLRGQNFEFIPFGSGRRMCPGTNFALHILRLTLASLLHDFRFEIRAPVDMTESFGVTSTMAAPLSVLVAPRLPSHLY